MFLRKINAIISLLTTVFLLDHAIFTSVWMLTKGGVAQSAPVAPWILASLMAIHAFISVYFAVSAHSESEKRKFKSYPNMNRATIFQRVSGILLIVFTALHISEASGAVQTPHIVHAILPPIFFTVALAHAAVSTDKAFITLGIGNAKVIRVINVVIKLICIATLIAAIAGFYLYVW